MLHIVQLFVKPDLLNYIAAIYIHLVNDIGINSSTAFLDVIYYIMNYKDIKLFQ